MPSTIVCDILSCKNVARGSIQAGKSDKHSFVVWRFQWGGEWMEWNNGKKRLDNENFCGWYWNSWGFAFKLKPLNLTWVMRRLQKALKAHTMICSFKDSKSYKKLKQWFNNTLQVQRLESHANAFKPLIKIFKAHKKFWRLTCFKSSEKLLKFTQAHTRVYRLHWELNKSFEVHQFTLQKLIKNLKA